MVGLEAIVHHKIVICLSHDNPMIRYIFLFNQVVVEGSFYRIASNHQQEVVSSIYRLHLLLSV